MKNQLKMLKNKLKILRISVIRNNILRILIIFLFLFISFILLTKFNEYFEQKDFAKLVIIVVIFINFLGAFFIKSYEKKGLIFFTYFILILYSVNSLIVYFDYKNTSKKNMEIELKKLNKNFDKRKIIEVVKDERLKGNNVYPYVVPREFLKKGRKEIPLTPIPNTEYISCNEFGTWKKIKTDKFGFNNKIFLKKFDILLMGDSFAEGSCVNQEYEPANLFEKKYNFKTYNIGISGNGPLISLALAHEINKVLEFNYIVWFIFDNDFYDLSLEIKSNYLKEYLNKDFLNNQYFKKIVKTNIFQKQYINNNLENFKRGYPLKENLLELKPLISRINKLLNSRANEDLVEYNKDYFEKIFDKINYLYPKKKIFIVYLPEATCFKHRSNECLNRFNELKTYSDKVIFLNFYDFLKKNVDNYKDMYALGQDRAHFSPSGYEYLVEFVYDSIERN